MRSPVRQVYMLLSIAWSLYLLNTSYGKEPAAVCVLKYASEVGHVVCLLLPFRSSRCGRWMSAFWTRITPRSLGVGLRSICVQSTTIRRRVIRQLSRPGEEADFAFFCVEVEFPLLAPAYNYVDCLLGKAFSFFFYCWLAEDGNIVCVHRVGGGFGKQFRQIVDV